jgi:hypothetical protein
LTLADQILLLEGINNGGPVLKGSLDKVVATLLFMQKWEPEIRANLPAWKAVREDPTLKALDTEIPIASLRVRHASE